VSWEGSTPVGLDLYYDPIVDEHVAHGPMGIIAPAWYFAPQRPDVAQAGWRIMASVNGIFGDGPIAGLDEPQRASMLLQLAGEFADAQTRQRIWAAAEEHIEPMWDRRTGEFTLGFGLNEAYPRGQLNARAMAGWVCTPGAWARIFTEPNLAKFAQPTVEGVDFPAVALSEARWDGAALHIAAHPQNAALTGSRTSVRICNITPLHGWTMTDADGATLALSPVGDHVSAEIVIDDRPVVIRRG